MIFAYFAFAILVQLDSTDIGVALEVIEMVAVFLIMLIAILHHKASRAARIGALYNQSFVDGHAIRVQRHKL